MGRASPLAQIDERIGGLLNAQPLGQGGRQQQAGVGDGMGVVKADVELVEGWGGPIENMPSWSGIRQLWQAPCSQVRRPSSESTGNHFIPGTVHPG